MVKKKKSKTSISHRGQRVAAANFSKEDERWSRNKCGREQRGRAEELTPAAVER